MICPSRTSISSLRDDRNSDSEPGVKISLIVKRKVGHGVSDPAKISSKGAGRGSQRCSLCWETRHKIGTCPLNVDKEVCSSKRDRLKQTMGHEDNMRMGREATNHNIDSDSYHRMPALANMFSYPYGMPSSIHGRTYQPHVIYSTLHYLQVSLLSKNTKSNFKISSFSFKISSFSKNTKSNFKISSGWKWHL